LSPVNGKADDDFGEVVWTSDVHTSGRSTGTVADAPKADSQGGSGGAVRTENIDDGRPLASVYDGAGLALRVTGAGGIGVVYSDCCNNSSTPLWSMVARCHVAGVSGGTDGCSVVVDTGDELFNVAKLGKCRL
jgi:hypothetical protein